MPLTADQKRYIKRNIQKISPDVMADNLNLPIGEVWRYIKNHWPKEKCEKLISGQKPAENYQVNTNINFKAFFVDNINIFILLFLLIFVAYINSLGNGFVSDDIPAFVDNPNLGKITNIFGYGIIGSLIQLTFFLGHSIGGTTPAFFRIFNIFFHVGSTFMVFWIFSALIKKRAAIIAAALFAIHPILTESVSWISGIPYSLSSFLILLSFASYIFKKNIFWPLSFFFLALLSLEKVMVFPFILLLYEFSQGGMQKIRENWKKLSLFFGLGFLWAALFLSKISHRISAVESSGYQPGQEELYNPFIQIPIAIGNYLKLIFWPDKLTLYHTEMSFNTLQYLGFLFTFLIFLGFVFWGWKKNKQVFFWLSFFFITLLPTLTPLKIAWIVAERYVYLGSIGIFVVVAIFFDWIYEKIKGGKEEYKYGSMIIFAIIILSLSARTIVRNMDWKNEDTLWIATAEVSPSGQNIHNNLGDVYGRQGNLEKAAEEFQKAIEINPRYADAYHNLGNTYRDMRKIDLAMENYQKALEFNPNLWQSYQSLAAIYFGQNDYQKALEYIQKALQIDSQNKNLQENLQVIQNKIQK